MTQTQQSVHGRSVTWSGINDAAIELVFAATLLIGSASLLAMSLGDPDTVALVAGLGVVVILLVLAVITVNRHLSADRSGGLVVRLNRFAPGACSGTVSRSRPGIFDG